MLVGGYFPPVAAVFFGAGTLGMTLLVRPATGPAILAAVTPLFCPVPGVLRLSSGTRWSERLRAGADG